MHTESSNPVNLILEAYELETTELTPTHRKDLRTYPPDVFVKLPETKWSNLDWKQVGLPYSIRTYSTHRSAWEERHGRKMPDLLQWKTYNKNLHELYHTSLVNRKMEVRKKLLSNLKHFKVEQADASLQSAIRLRIWDYLHRKEDAMWDPRGKRAFLDGLDIKHPRILHLGAGDGYDAMILISLYGGEAQLVDFDDFCMTDRFGKFPTDYPFIARDPKTNYWNVFNKDDFNIEYKVEDIHKLTFSKEFDIVISSGLIEHFPDKYKPLIFHLHRQFLKPGGHIIFTASRNYARLRAFYHLMSEKLNYMYRELMSAPQLGLYAHQNGFKILRCGYIKAHNLVVAKEK